MLREYQLSDTVLCLQREITMIMLDLERYSSHCGNIGSARLFFMVIQFYNIFPRMPKKESEQLVSSAFRGERL